MKQILLTLFLLFFYSIKAQNVTVSNLINLYNLDITDSEEYMSKLKWNFTKNYDDNNGFTYITFTQKDINNNVIYLSKTYGENKFVGMTFYSRTKKVSYINELKSKGFILLNKYMKNGSIHEKYIKNNIEFSISTKPNNEYFITCGVNYN